MANIQEPIAIIGSSCRFPGDSSSPSKLSELLQNPRDVGSKIDRFSADGFYHKDGAHHGTSNVLNSYPLNEDPRNFDAQFFGIPKAEAESIDPQQRMLLEVVFEALEKSGHQMEELSGSATAVYVGVMCNDYAHITYHDLESLPKMAATGTALSILSNRVSYYFNWTGPSMTIDTACSSSLIATHQAVQSLRSGESNLAVAAGANLILGPTNFVAESNVNMLSPTGRSRMWDSKADGYARGEGIAAVFLKRLSDAIRDGDHIEAIVRETGINQDGRTPGITMPSSNSQSNLIRETYARAGLSLDKDGDRCQYFEAHGTGTKAGDPQEAAAIHQAFFGNREEKDTDEVLYVGSIKTIIGHTEGTAGLAGLLKASLSVQTGTIFPNLLFEDLNPDIEPYYDNLQIVQDAKPWPTLPAGVPRRASVNSFGFGGANAHAIIECYDPQIHNALLKEVPRIEEVIAPEPAIPTMDTLTAIPFMFSGNSEKTLATQIETYLSFLETLLDRERPVNMGDLAWTLSRRSAFALRAHCSATSLQSLRDQLEEMLDAKKNDNKNLGARPSHKTQSIFGIFTGQGAQWPSMGNLLIETSPFAARLFQELDDSLQRLPEQDRPSWHIQKELTKAKDSSRVMEAAFSQPLCTAVQVVLVQMLGHAGISFDAVVGHSSGEIAAAYAAGFLSASDAVRIAYYRGFFGKFACGPEGVGGAMAAVGTSQEDATELCELPTMQRYGRIRVAATNSSASVTLSGDQTAIDRAKFVFEDEKKFVRRLKVDTAYHSHHMEPCAEPYMDAMARVQIGVQQPKKECRWFSSVLGGKEVTDDMKDQICGSYWKDNLLEPVMFSQALESALEAVGAPALMLEVGAHPALKGPAIMVAEEKTGAAVPYSGVLARGSHDAQKFSDAIGAVWENVGTSVLTMRRIDEMFRPQGSKPTLLQDVPLYTWDHSTPYWTESRKSRALRLRPHSHNELLGARIDSGENELQWRNFLKPSELPWVKGHQIQGQIIFPGAGFAAMAVEACKAFVSEGSRYESIALIELQDLTIRRAVSFPDESIGVESVVTLSNIKRDEESGLVECDFVCETSLSKDSPLAATSTASIKLLLGTGSADMLPPRAPQPSSQKMIDVDCEVFYDSLAKLGYNYADSFVGIKALERTTGNSAGTIHIKGPEDYETELIIHPAPLDVAFQGIFGAIGSPGDGQLWTLMVPTVIRSMRINVSGSEETSCLDVDVAFDASVSADPLTHEVSGDVDVFDMNGNAILQIEGLHVTPVSQVTENDDAQKISKSVWGPDRIDAGQEFTSFWDITRGELDMASFVERACFYYMKKMNEAMSPERMKELEPHLRKYFTWISSVIDEVAAGTHTTIREEWLKDTAEEMDPMLGSFAEKREYMRSIMTFGQNLVQFALGEAELDELSYESRLLENIYTHTFGLQVYHKYLAGLVEQLAHKTRQMQILEVGAGAGSATQAIMSRIGDDFGSYTYTDLSPAFLSEAQTLFAKQSDKFIYKAYDVEQEASGQGIRENAYDLVVASVVLHATTDLNQTLTNLRKTLKPGGHLALLNFTDARSVKQPFVFGTMPSWWAGQNDEVDINNAEARHSLLSQFGWDNILRETGFSGVDSATPETRNPLVPFAVMLTQAVDGQMKMIRQPLAPENATSVQLPKLLVLGGKSESTTRLQRDVLAALEPFSKSSEVVIVDHLEDLNESHFGEKQLLLSLMELDTPAFCPFTPERWTAMQLLTEKALNILWLTRGVSGDNPYSNMMVGVSRCLIHEKPDLRFQVVDFESLATVDPTCVAELLMRLHISSQWKSFMTPYQPAWVLEREIRVEDGEFMIPRCVPSKDLDARHNSVRRTITVDVPLKESLVAIVANANSSFELHEIKKPVWAAQAEIAPNSVEIEVFRSTLSAVEIPRVGSQYIVIGRKVQGQEKVVALSETLKSKMFVRKDWVLEIDTPDEQDSNLIVSAVNTILAADILAHASKPGAILVHEPSVTAATALTDLAAEEEAVDVVLTTTSRDRKKEEPEMVFVHTMAHKKTICSVIPDNISTFVNLAKPGYHAAQTAARTGDLIEAQVPSKVLKMHLESTYDTNAVVTARVDDEAVLGILQRAQDFFKVHSDLPSAEGFKELGLADISTYKQKEEALGLAVVNWTLQDTVPVKLSPPEREVQFRPNRTYWLAGLTSDLGLTLTRWMSQRGAKYVVMTSRNPQVDEEWIAAMKAAGTIVRILPMDLTDAKSVKDTYNIITRTLPPIAGVCNGATVMNDELMAKQSYEDFIATLRPKVEGTIHLDTLFQEPGELDFFMVFSSLAYSTGNIGQSAYAAANGFMVSMVERRRKRGLAGSVIHMAGIYGIGLITRREAGIMDRLEKMGYFNISEWDYLQFFAEGVLAGTPESRNKTWEISSSVRPGDVDGDNPPPWLDVPRFSFFKRIKRRADDGDDTTVSVRAQLKDQTTEEGVRNVLYAGLVGILYKLLGMKPEDNIISPSTALIELGIDSLVAVDMRFWFTRELDLDLPVLKLLGGATVEEMVEDVINRLSPSLTPNVKIEKTEGESAANDDGKTEKPPAGDDDKSATATSSEASDPIVNAKAELNGTISAPTGDNYPTSRPESSDGESDEKSSESDEKLSMNDGSESLASAETEATDIAEEPADLQNSMKEESEQKE
ncbi:putative polyketide synthase [Xylaria cubensis]|nr:putative polyketide synthase [Xylaria cubensis]